MSLLQCSMQKKSPWMKVWKLKILSLLWQLLPTQGQTTIMAIISPTISLTTIEEGAEATTTIEEVKEEETLTLHRISSINSHKISFVVLNQRGLLAKSVVNVDIWQLIAIIGWTMLIMESIHLQNFLLWLLPQVHVLLKNNPGLLSMQPQIMWPQVLIIEAFLSPTMVKVISQLAMVKICLSLMLVIPLFLHLILLFILKKVLRVLSIASNLAFVHKIWHDNNCGCYFDVNILSIQALATRNVLYQGKSEGGVCPIYPHKASKLSLTSKLCNNVALSFVFNKTLWHMRLGHPHDQVLHVLFSKFKYVSNKCTNFDYSCTDCLYGKMHKLPFPKSQFTASSPFELSHSYLWGPTPVTSMNGFKYYVLFIDHFTRFTWLYLLQSKSEVFDKFVHFKNLIENQFSTKIKTFRSDGGGQYTSTTFKSYLSHNGIIHQISCPYNLQQNGLVERKHRHLIETTITLLSHTSILTTY